MYLGFEQVEADATVKTSSALTIPDDVTHAELQADTSDIRYTMDDSTDPSQSSGMVLGTAHQPKSFLITDIRNIRFTRGSGSNGNLNLHYFGGRNIT